MITELSKDNLSIAIPIIKRYLLSIKDIENDPLFTNFEDILTDYEQLIISAVYYEHINNIYKIYIPDPISIYLFNAAGTYHYKIGVSGNVSQRIDTLSTARGERINEIFSIKTDRKIAFKIEKMLHNKYKPNLIGNEWFMFDDFEVENVKQSMFLTVNAMEVENKSIYMAPRFDFNKTLFQPIGICSILSDISVYNKSLFDYCCGVDLAVARME